MAKAAAEESGGIPNLAKVVIVVCVFAAIGFGFSHLIKLARHRELVRNVSHHPHAEVWWPDTARWADTIPDSRAIWFGPIVRDVWANPDSPQRVIYGFEMESGECLAGRPGEHDDGDRIYLDIPDSGSSPLDPIPSVDEQWAIAVERDDNGRNVIVSGVRIIVPE